MVCCLLLHLLNICVRGGDVVDNCGGVWINAVVRIGMIVVDGIVVCCRCCHFHVVMFLFSGVAVLFVNVL